MITATMGLAALVFAFVASPLFANCLPHNDNSNSNGQIVSTPQDEVGAVFVMTNAAADNEVIAFSRNAAGMLTEVGQYSTGGRGIGVDFDTQAPLVLNDDHSFLYALSPGDDLVTVFAVNGSGLNKVQTIYAGDQPLSIALSSTGYAYVMDGSVASTGIFGFEVDQQDGTLMPLTNATIPLSTPIGVPGVVTFSPDGSALVVANKVGSTLDVFAVGDDGHAMGPMTTSASSGFRPFSAVFNQDTLYVIESGLPAIKNSAVSTYNLNKGSVPSLSALTKSARNDQTDGCWILITPDNKYLYTANFVSNTISSYSLAANGTVELLSGDAADTGEMSQPVDLGLSEDGKFLYNLLRGTGAILGYAIQDDGSLKQVGGSFGMGRSIPAADGASGLASF